jgi:hypothetical protein
MNEPIKALPPEGPAKCAQKRTLNGESIAYYRRVLVLTLGFCLLLADAVNWPWGLGNSVTVYAWYLLLLLAVGRERLFSRRESRVLLVWNLVLASTFGLTSNPLFRVWNFLALLILVPIHAMASLGSRPWWDLWMLAERFQLLLQGLLGNLWACFAAAVPEKPSDGKPKRTMAVVLGLCGAAVLVSVLLPVLASADALFAASLEALNWDIRMLRFGDLFQRLFWALILTPFVFGLLYAMTHPKQLCPPEKKKFFQMDALGFVLALAAVDGLYLAFLAVQSAGLFGGPEYLESLGVSYAEWARSGFFQMVGVTVVNLSLTLASLSLSRREGGSWRALRWLCAVLAGESLVLLASAAWRMTLYVSAYGLSFKRCMTYWGMVMMALLLLAGLWKVRRPDFRFCKWAFPLALAGWLVINCVPVDYLVARDQVNRYLRSEAFEETPVISLSYLVDELSYDTLHQLARLDSRTDFFDWRTGEELPLGEILRRRRREAWEDCQDWRSWTFSACLAKTQP